MPSRRKKPVERSPEHFLELSEMLNYVGQVVAKGVAGAVWVRAEIALITDRRHLYMDLVEVGHDGEVAKCRAVIWARERDELENKFQQATGGMFSSGLKVLLFCTAEFHPQYGFSLHVLDVAPEFTLGEAAKQVQAIREQLQQEGLYELNKQLELPSDFTRVAVISPKEAAGLGDFKREVDPLAQASILEIHYLTATFQGKQAEGSLLTAIIQAKELHEQQSLDALFVIRGGGATTDLAWLNSLEVAGTLAQFPVPVITGLGHARDSTILDEIAHTLTDTPSKAAHFLVRTIVDAATEAANHVQQIQEYSAQLVAEAELLTQATKSRVYKTAQHTLLAEANQVVTLMRQALGLSPQSTLARGYVLVRNQAGELVTKAEQGLTAQKLTLEFVDGEMEVIPIGKTKN